MRKKAHEMLAIWGGRAPHPQSIVPGGSTELVDAQKVIDFSYRLKELKGFIENVYVPTVKAVADVYADYLEVGAGCKNLMSFGAFPQSSADSQGANGFFKRGASVNGKDIAITPDLITEEVKYSWYNDDTAGSRHPSESVITPDPRKPGAYSWLKATPLRR